VVELYRFLPSFNLDNARSWFLEAHAFTSPLVAISHPPTLACSLLLLVGWIGLLFGVAAWTFNRQDIGA
jgi:hypothetical protein